MKAQRIKRLHGHLLIIPLPGSGLLRMAGIATIFIFLMYSHTAAQQLDVPYVSTPHTVVEEMLDLANVGADDYVIDLGCGDGRIVVSAAKRGAFGHGIDLDPERINEAEENARIAGVQDRVLFLQQDIFKTDFSRANVITMYLLSSVNLKLRPVLLDSLKPGTKIVSHNFDMGDWKPDKEIRVDDNGFKNRSITTSNSVSAADQNFTLENWVIEQPMKIDTSGFDLGNWMINNHIKLQNLDIALEEQTLKEPLSINTHTIYYWVVPAKVEGQWNWQSNGKNFTMQVKQKFQEIELTIHRGRVELMIDKSSLTGERIAFTAVDPSSETQYVYNGRVNEDRIRGKVQIRRKNKKSVENWSARMK